MARPTINEIYGYSSSWVTSANPSIGNGLFIAEDDLWSEGGYPGSLPVDGQKVFWQIVLKVAQQLNEANRNNNAEGIKTTITYGEYDNIIDPPGSNNVFRRDVFSLIAYQSQQYTPFSPDTV